MMAKKIVICLLSIFIAFSFAACKKKEEQLPPSQGQGTGMPGPIMPPGQMPPEQMPPGQMPPGQMPPGQMPPGAPTAMMPKGETKVVIPNAIKGQWVSAKIVIEDKTTKQKQEYLVKLNSDFKVPNSNLRIHVGDFLPDFRMDGLNLTSGSNEARNPALGIQVFENDKKIFPATGKKWGWLFSKVPTIHPFEHPKYGIILKEGVKKG